MMVVSSNYQLQKIREAGKKTNNFVQDINVYLNEKTLVQKSKEASKSMNMIGQQVKRVDAYGKVTGEAKYTACLLYTSRCV